MSRFSLKHCNSTTAIGSGFLWIPRRGARTQRPGLDACLESLREGNVSLVWRLDRLGRSMPHLVNVVTELRERGVGFRLICDGMIDTTTAYSISTHSLAMPRSGMSETWSPRSLSHLPRACLGTSLAAAMADADPAVLQTVIAEVTEGLSAYEDDQGLALPMQAWVVTAKA